MAGRRNYVPPNRRWLDGTEYGGVENTVAGGIQPKLVDALSNADILRLGYVTGQDVSTEIRTNIDDHRQMLGLRPAGAPAKRPLWLDGVSDTDDVRLKSEARYQGYGSDEDDPVELD